MKRIVPLEEVAQKDYYSDMAELAVIFNHEIIETENDIWRWKPNTLTNLISDNCPFMIGYEAFCPMPATVRGKLSLNDLWMDLYKGLFSVEEMMKHYMQIGYSLSGYCEVFGQRTAKELNLPRPGKKDLINYMKMKYKGQVLKL